MDFLSYTLIRAYSRDQIKRLAGSTLLYSLDSLGEGLRYKCESYQWE